MLLCIVHYVINVLLSKEHKRRGETNNQVFLPDILAYQVTSLKGGQGSFRLSMMGMVTLVLHHKPYRASFQRQLSCTNKVDIQKRYMHCRPM